MGDKMLRIRLKEMRKRAGVKSQADMARMLGVPERRYASWERGEAMPSLEQAYNCAIVLNCTIDEIAGLDHGDAPEDHNVKNENPYARELVECFEGSSAEGRRTIINVARSTRATTGDAAPRTDAGSDIA